MSKQQKQNGQFHSTHWSVIASAASGCDEALAELCANYWQPLYWQVRRMGYEVADAQDLTQSFLTRLIEKRLVTQVDSSRGRFRTFLLTALRRYVINEWKRGRSQRAGGSAAVLSLDFAGAEEQMALEPWHDITPDVLFERRWAVQVLENAVARLEADQRDAGNSQLFERLAPYLTAMGDVPSYQSIAVEFNKTTGALKMTVSRWRKDLGRLIRDEIRKTVSDERDIDDEFRRLLIVLAK